MYLSVLAGEEGNRCGNVDGLTDMAEREVRFQVRNGLTRMDRADEPGTHIGVDQPWYDDVGANPVAALFAGEGSYGDFQGCFRHGVGRAVGRGVGDCGAGDRNDVAAAAWRRPGNRRRIRWSGPKVWMRSSWSNSDNDELATVLPRLADPALLTRRSIAPSTTVVDCCAACLRW